ncbi:MAG TPA: 5'/3'-nucleotidase SurE [Phycisphaerae bacterium]|nr:5'/3'-nucleotidase SurE [Phycisphaerae bacterium]
MHILLTNDDGILAPGLRAMRRELARLGEVSVVAPDTVQSAAAHAITINAPLVAKRVHVHKEFHGWSVAGRPADCVKLAVDQLLERPPDLVVSGINDGANVSINVLYSGTVAAAAEGALLGFPSIAVSLEWGAELDFDWAARIAGGLIDRAVAAPLSPGQLLNVNIPDLSSGPPLGVRVAPQTVQRMDDYYERRDAPDGSDQYYLQGWFKEPDGDVAGDLKALLGHYVVVTPLHFDLTDHAQLRDLAGWEWGPIPS